MGAIDDILEWSITKLSPWRQDALRRLASSSTLTAQDEIDLLGIIKKKAGFDLLVEPPQPDPLTLAHFAAVTPGPPLQISCLRNVRGVNCLEPAASLSFCSQGLTVIYGRNGSGKSGFVRILRSACRTRVDNRAKLKVLGDVYGSSESPQEAEIVVSVGGEEIVVPWKPGAAASEILLQVGVFDTAAAQFYVDSGNQIHFLPFGLALPHKLNELCLTLRKRLEAEHEQIKAQLLLATVRFATERKTTAQSFFRALNEKATDRQVAAHSNFSQHDERRLDELTRLLAASTASAADVSALSSWAENLATDCDSLAVEYSDANLVAYQALKLEASEARTAAGLKAADLFSNEPLSGVGGETWRRLWLSARDYSIANAYPGRDFPVLSTIDPTAICVLCQQPLDNEATIRLDRFRSFVDGELAEAAARAEVSVAQAIQNLPKIERFASKDWTIRLDQVGKRNAELAETLLSFGTSLEARQTWAMSALGDSVSGAVSSLAALESPKNMVQAFSKLLFSEANVLENVDQEGKRAKLVEEQAELADLKVLTASRDVLIKRRDLLKENFRCVEALREVQTKGITQRANELVDTHLTKTVIDQFNAERRTLQIMHLRTTLLRKSDPTKASFQTDTGTRLTRLTSDILSEGEQRALALAAFLTEVAVTEGKGPIVIDDPVSSLDRERGLRFATRIAAEAKERQVIIFTHDLIFFNDLCREAEDCGVMTETVALFNDGTMSGKVDPAGVSWKGLNVNKRLTRIKNDFIPLRSIHRSSPGDYEIRIKHLYGRLRDTYERLVEECIFCDVLRRGVVRIETQKLRLVHLSDGLATRFHDGMTKANTHSHDNPASDTVPVPNPNEFDCDIIYIEQLIFDLKVESIAREGRRPGMKYRRD